MSACSGEGARGRSPRERSPAPLVACWRRLAMGALGSTGVTVPRGANSGTGRSRTSCWWADDEEPSEGAEGSGDCALLPVRFQRGRPAGSGWSESGAALSTPVEEAGPDEAFEAVVCPAATEGSSRRTPTRRRVSARALRPASARVSMACLAVAGSRSTVAAAPSAMVIMTAREWATTSCISRAMRLRSSAAARSTACSLARAIRAERSSMALSRRRAERVLKPIRMPIRTRRTSMTVVRRSSPTDRPGVVRLRSSMRTTREMPPAVHAVAGLRCEATAPRAKGSDISPMPLTPMVAYSSCSSVRWKARRIANW